VGGSGGDGKKVRAKRRLSNGGQRKVSLTGALEGGIGFVGSMALFEASCRTWRAGGMSRHKNCPRESNQQRMTRLKLMGC